MVGVFGDGEPQIGISDMIGSSLREGFFFFLWLFSLEQCLGGKTVL